MSKIIPTIGRVVHYNQNGLTMAAIVVRVWSESLVNLAVFDGNGIPFSRTVVRLIQAPYDSPPAPNEEFASWMPYQIGQAAKTEELMAAAKSAPVHEGDASISPATAEIGASGG